jgi:hypothetical protein
MSQRLVDGSSADFNGRDVAEASIQKDDTQDLLVKQLHVGAGFVNHFGIVESLGECLFGFGDSEMLNAAAHFAAQAELKKGSSQDRSVAVRGHRLSFILIGVCYFAHRATDRDIVQQAG